MATSTQVDSVEAAKMTILAIDVGSEFVDVAVQTTSGCHIRKVANHGRNDVDAILIEIEAAFAAWSVRLEEIEIVNFGSTSAVNAILAGDGSRVALFTTQGFGDCLWLARQSRAELYDPVARSPAPTFLVDRANTFEIAGRIDAKGHEVLRLDETAIRAALDTIRANGIEAIAVCFLFSHVNSVHERRCRELIHDVLPEIDICLSHEIDQQPREYERTVSVCLEAWLRPMMTRAMSALSKGLRQRGFRGRLFYADGSASLIEEDAARARVSHLITGGPSAAARCAEVAARIVGAPTAISLDIGSMSADIALIDHGVLQICRNTAYAGVPVRQHMVDVASINLGGRSQIVCNRHGQFAFESRSDSSGSGLTLSDALSFLDRISTSVTVDAQSALLKLGRLLGNNDAQAIARGAIAAAERIIAHAVLAFAVKRNVDPSMAALIAMGGLGGILAAGIAELLGMKQVGFPDAPAAAGALGLLMSGPNFDAHATVNSQTTAITDADLRVAFKRLADATREQAVSTGWNGELVLRATVEMAVTAHMHPQYVVLSELPQSVATIMTAFQDQHFERYGTFPPEIAYIFSVMVERAGVETHLSSRSYSSISDCASCARVGGMLVETTAGVIWKPEHWSLTRYADAYLLRAEPNQ